MRTCMFIGFLAAIAALGRADTICVQSSMPDDQRNRPGSVLIIPTENEPKLTKFCDRGPNLGHYVIPHIGSNSLASEISDKVSASEEKMKNGIQAVSDTANGSLERLTRLEAQLPDVVPRQEFVALLRQVTALEERIKLLEKQRKQLAASEGRIKALESQRVAVAKVKP